MRTTRRQDIAKQAKRGWITPNAAAILMGFDLDTSKLAPYIGNGGIGIIETRPDGKLRLSDVLAVADGGTLKELLDKRLPINRQKAPARKTAPRVLKTATERHAFERRWNRLQEHVFTLIGTKAADFGWREHRLFNQLMRLSYRAKRFELIVPSGKLMLLTGLNKDHLPIARYNLEDRKILVKDSPREGTTARVYTFLDPATGQPFDDLLDDSDIPLDTSTSWLELGQRWS
jgi:hypothetical protein